LDVLFMAAAVIVCAVLMVPRIYRRRLLGVINLADFIGTMVILGHFSATGSVIALLIAVTAMLGLTLTLRAARAWWGCERLSVNGDTSLKTVVATLITQASMWVRTTFSSLILGREAQAPKQPTWAWVETLEAVSFKAGWLRFWATI
jgi:hypothetical protein